MCNFSSYKVPVGLIQPIHSKSWEGFGLLGKSWESTLDSQWLQFLLAGQHHSQVHSWEVWPCFAPELASYCPAIAEVPYTACALQKALRKTTSLFQRPSGLSAYNRRDSIAARDLGYAQVLHCLLNVACFCLSLSPPPCTENRATPGAVHFQCYIQFPN